MAMEEIDQNLVNEMEDIVVVDPHRTIDVLQGKTLIYSIDGMK